MLQEAKTDLFNPLDLDPKARNCEIARSVQI